MLHGRRVVKVRLASSGFDLIRGSLVFDNTHERVSLTFLLLLSHHCPQVSLTTRFSLLGFTLPPLIDRTSRIRHVGLVVRRITSSDNLTVNFALNRNNYPASTQLENMSPYGRIKQCSYSWIPGMTFVHGLVCLDGG